MKLHPAIPVAFLLGCFAIVYATTMAALKAPPDPPHVQPEWTTDRYGRPHPNPLYNPPEPYEKEIKATDTQTYLERERRLEEQSRAEAMRLQEARMKDQKELEENWLETTEEKQARIKARDEANRRSGLTPPGDLHN